MVMLMLIYHGDDREGHASLEASLVALPKA